MKHQNTSPNQNYIKRLWSLWIIHYNFLKREKYCQEIHKMNKGMQHFMFNMSQLKLPNSSSIAYLKNNSEEIEQTGWQNFSRPNLPNPPLSDYHFFKHLDNFLQEFFNNQTEAENVFEEFISSKIWKFYHWHNGCQQFIYSNDNYVDQWILFQDEVNCFNLNNIIHNYCRTNPIRWSFNK